MKYGLLTMTLAMAFIAISGPMPVMADAQEQIWRNSFSRDASGKLVRFIPLELWSGAKWNGDRNLDRAPPFDHHASRISDKAPIHITGPIQVSPKDHPNCSKNPIYKLDAPRRRYHKIQYYQINIEAGGKKGGIGRCWDKRDDEIKNMREFSKFPIGYWAEGETYKNIRILELGTPGSSCLKFRWRGGRNGKGWGEYVYCPGLGRTEGDSGRQRRETGGWR